MVLPINRRIGIRRGHHTLAGGRSTPLTNHKWMDLQTKITPNRIPISAEPTPRPADLRIYITDNGEIERATGWQPKKSLDMIFLDIFEWLKANELQLNTILK